VGAKQIPQLWPPQGLWNTVCSKPIIKLVLDHSLEKISPVEADVVAHILDAQQASAEPRSPTASCWLQFRLSHFMFQQNLKGQWPVSSALD